MSACPLNKYKNILGIPSQGIHQYRFLDTAVADYIMTIMLSCLFTYISKIPLVLTTIICFILGIILHIIFGVETNTLTCLGIKC